jgi:dGTPase
VLERLRFRVERSLGRRYPEPEHPYRNAFQRDRDRIVHARAFRRLEAKTQVFSPGLSDHFRNRLTHTIEVSQIARTLASVLGLDEDLTEALALVHDIGHPPFAHAGEEELNRQMSRFGERFDHNIHALRIVEKFEQRYARFPGLNLTFEVREGMAKHSRDFEAGEIAELDEYMPGKRPPLESQLIDLADEIAYNTADLDDAFSARLFTAEEVAAEVPEYAQIYETIEVQFPGAAPREKFHEALRRVIDALVSGLIQGTLESARKAGVSSPEQVRETSQRLVVFAPTAQCSSRGLKNFLIRRVYSSPALEQGRRESVLMMSELFGFLLVHPNSLPEPYREMMETEPAHRVVCDYIAGMTDSFFRRTYEQMLGPTPPSP